MEKVIYKNQGGMGIILDLKENENDFIIPQALKIVDSLLNPGEFTDLHGLFTEPIRFCGLLKNETSKTLVFHTGDSSTLFESKKYYYCFVWIHNLRLANSYSYLSMRDFNWVNGSWK